MARLALLVLAAISATSTHAQQAATSVGKLVNKNTHGVAGDVFILDEKSFAIRVRKNR